MLKFEIGPLKSESCSHRLDVCVCVCVCHGGGGGGISIVKRNYWGEVAVSSVCVCLYCTYVWLCPTTFYIASSYEHTYYTRA